MIWGKKAMRRLRVIGEVEDDLSLEI